MSIKKIIILILPIITLSCQPENSLDINELSDPPEYFVECFCKPGDLYQLTATRVTRMSDDFIWDLSIPFKTYITDSTSHELYQGVFYDDYSHFIYNYASPLKVPVDFTDSLYLRIISPTGDTIRGKTHVVSQTKISNYNLKNNDIEISFNIDPSVDKRHYIINVENWKEGGIINSEKLFSNFGTSDKESETVNITSSTDVQELDSIRIKVFHVTGENYNYQISLNDAIKSNENNITQPAPLKGNLNGSLGIFTYYTEDIATYIPSKQ